MHHRFHVDADELRSAASAARTAADAASRGALRAATGLGPAAIDDAVTRLADRWSSGLDHLHTDVGEVVSRLKATAQLYEDGDAAGADAADRAGGGMPGK